MQSTRHKSDKMATDSPDEDLTVGTASNSFIWNPPDKDTTTGKASNVLIWMFPDPNNLGCSFSSLRSILIAHLPTTVSEESNLTFLKNGYYQTAGEILVHATLIAFVAILLVFSIWLKKLNSTGLRL
jgi:hypothetical protein